MYSQNIFLGKLNVTVQHLTVDVHIQYITGYGVSSSQILLETRDGINDGYMIL